MKLLINSPAPINNTSVAATSITTSALRSPLVCAPP